MSKRFAIFSSAVFVLGGLTPSIAMAQDGGWPTVTERSDCVNFQTNNCYENADSYSSVDECLAVWLPVCDDLNNDPGGPLGGGTGPGLPGFTPCYENNTCGRTGSY